MKRKLSSLILICLSLILVSSLVVYAAFVMTHNYEADIKYHEITITDGTDNSILSNEVKDDKLTFANPGDEVEFTYSLKNLDKKPYNYYFSLSVVLAENETANEELLNMIYVYQDDVYCGVLADYLSVNLPDNLPTNKTIFKNENLVNATTIKYQLHNGASKYINNTITVQVECHLETINAQKYLYTTNSDVSKVVDDINSIDGKTMVLTEPITIPSNSNYIIGTNSTIDLCGQILTLNDDITIASDVKIIDSRGGGKIQGDYNLVLTGSNSFVELKVATNKIDTRAGFNQTRLFECLVGKNDSVLKSFDYFVNDETYNPYGNYIVYGNTFLTFKDITFENFVASVSSNGVASITCKVGNNTETVEYKTYLNNTDALIQEIKDRELKHIVAYDCTKTTYDLLHDIYLPTAIKKYNATISWWSSDESVLSNDGRTQEAQGFITLIATIKLNDEIFTETFLIHVAKQDDMMRLQYLVSKIGMIELDHVGLESGKILPTKIGDVPENATDAEKLEYYKYYTLGENLGITEITYEVENSYYYLGLDNGNKVYLNQITFQKYARVKITAKFDGGKEEGETSYVNVKILLQNDPTLQKKVFDYVQTQLDAVNVLELILQTRATEGVNNERGDFTLPTEYMNIGIKYSVSALHYGDLVSGTNGYDVEKPINGQITLDLNKLKLNEIRVPITVELIIDDEKTPAATKTLYFNVPPALTVDNFGFANSMDIFNTLQLQTLQYNSEHYISDDSIEGGKLYFSNIEDITYITDLKNYNTTNRKSYILMHDIEQCQELVFELGDASVVLDKYQISHLQTLFDWATDTTGEESRNTVPLDETLDWIESDGLETISDGEILVILTYCERFIGFENEWIEDIHVGDNILSSEDIVELMSTLVDQEFVTLLDWATGPSDVVVPTITTSLPDYVKTTIADGKSTISYLEEEVILEFIEKKYSSNSTLKNTIITEWFNSIKKNDDVYLNDTNDGNGKFTSVPTMETDYILKTIIEWDKTTDTYGLASKLTNGEMAALFDGNDYANESHVGSIFGSTYRITSDAEWEVIKLYFKTCYGLDLTQYITRTQNNQPVLSDYTGNNTGLTFNSPLGGTYTVSDSEWLVSFTRYYLTDNFLSALQALANSYLSNMGTVKNLLTWATSPNRTASTVTVQNPVVIDDQNINLNVRTSDGRATVNIFEYNTIISYYDANACNGVQPILKEWFKKYYITNRLNLTFRDETLTIADKENLYEAISDGKTENFNNIINLMASTGSVNPNGAWYDNLYTISVNEYNYLLNQFKTINNFETKLNQVIQFESTPDRTLDDSRALIEFVRSYLEYTDGDKFKYSLINKIDNTDLSVLECLKYYTILEELSVRGNSISSICDNTNKIFNIVGTNNLNLKELEFTYCELSDISPIVNLSNLEVINLRGNQTLTDVHYILEINNGQIRMINIFGTGVDFTYTEPDFIKMYIGYFDKNNTTPKYYYDLKGVETIFELTDNLTEADFEAMDLCYLLASIKDTNSNRLQLTTYVYILNNSNEVTRIEVEWSRVSGAVSDPIVVQTTDTNGNVLKYCYVTTNGGEIVISATINYGGGSYTRYFTFTNNI